MKLENLKSAEAEKKETSDGIEMTISKLESVDIQMDQIQLPVIKA